MLNLGLHLGIGGRCGRVETDGDGVPGFSMLTYEPALWLKASTIAQEDNTAVAEWLDGSGNGWSGTQATASKRPTRISSGPLVRSDGIDDYLYATGTLSLSAFSLFIVVEVVAAGGGDVGVFEMRKTDTGIPILSLIVASGGYFARIRNDLGALSDTARAGSGGGVKLLHARWDGSELTLRLNGVTGSPVSVGGSITLNEAYIGSGGNAGSTFGHSQTDKYEIALLPYAASVEQEQEIEQALAAAYNITLA